MLAVFEPDEHLVQHDVVEDGGAGRLEQLGKQSRVCAGSFDQVGDPGAPRDFRPVRIALREPGSIEGRPISL